MISFIQYLRESSGFTTAQFPLISHALSTLKKSATKRFVELLDAMNKATEIGEIEKKEFTVLTNAFRAVTGDIGDTIKAKFPPEPEMPVGEDAKLPDGNYAYTVQRPYKSLLQSVSNAVFLTNYNSRRGYVESAHNSNPYKSLGPDWKKLNDQFEEMYKLYNDYDREISVLANGMFNVEKLIPTKASKAAKAAFLAPQSTKDAKALVEKVLVKMTEEVKVDFEKERRVKWLKDLGEFFEKEHEEKMKHLGMDDESKEALRKKNQENIRKGFKSEQRQPRFVEQFLQHVCKPRTLEPLPNWQQIVKALAKEEADAMQRNFVDKNIGKLASIVEKKNNIDGDPRIIHMGARQGVAEGELEFKFLDKSSFRVRSKIVFKYIYSSSGSATAFSQYPTTFHDAILPNGTRMPGQPSEKEMNEIFAVA